MSSHMRIPSHEQVSVKTCLLNYLLLFPSVCQHLGPSTRLIRVQPNLACALQCGVSAFCKGTCAQEKDVELVKKLLQTSGR